MIFLHQKPHFHSTQTLEERFFSQPPPFFLSQPPLAACSSPSPPNRPPPPLLLLHCFTTKPATTSPYSPSWLHTPASVFWILQRDQASVGAATPTVGTAMMPAENPTKNFLFLPSSSPCSAANHRRYNFR